MTTLSKSLSLKTDNSSLGRYWIANETIPSGTLLVKESPIASIPNCQITENKVTDPINNKTHSLCWNCCSLFQSNTSNTSDHYCSNNCKTQSSKIMDILLNPSLSFNKSIQNDSTLRLTLFMLLKMIHYTQENKRETLLSNIDNTFNEFNKTPSKFYKIFSNKNHNEKHLLLQYKISNISQSNELYQSYLKKLSEIIPELLEYLSLDLSATNIDKLSVYFLNIIFVNGFGIRYSLVHDDDMLGLSLFYNASFFNHSCSPNAFYHFLNGNTIIIRTLREIQKNEAITISIVDDLECHTKQQRQHMLLSHFGFNCLCHRCINEEYINNNELLIGRINENDCIINNKQHINLLHFARTNWSRESNKNNQPIISWKFYKKLFTEYQYYYHPFDPDILSLLQEISQKAFMIKDYKIGYDAAELGRQFCLRLTSSGIIEQCHLTEFRFIFLSFLNYLHLIKSQYPNQQIEEIMKLNTKINDINDTNDINDINVTDQNDNDSDNDVVLMNDDILVKMFENDAMISGDKNEQNDNVIEQDIFDGSNADIETIETVKSIDSNKKADVIVSKGKKDKKKNIVQHKHKNKNNKNNHRKQKSKGKKYIHGKQKGNKYKHKQKQKYGSKHNNKNNDKKRDIMVKDKNVKVYKFGNDEYAEYDERLFEMKDEEEDEMEQTLEYELNEKIIELFATRSILFPKFQDFEQWIGNDLLVLDNRIENVVMSLKDKFDENV
eukprot:445214_1